MSISMHNLQILKMLSEPRCHFGHGSDMPKADGNPRCIGRESQNVKAGLFIAERVVSGFDGTQQIGYGTGASVGIIRWRFGK